MRLDEHVTITGDLDSGEVRMSARPRAKGSTGYVILPPEISKFIWKVLQSSLDETINIVSNQKDES
jgi:hypothetical protein